MAFVLIVIGIIFLVVLYFFFGILLKFLWGWLPLILGIILGIVLGIFGGWLGAVLGIILIISTIGGTNYWQGTSLYFKVENIIETIFLLKD